MLQYLVMPDRKTRFTVVWIFSISVSLLCLFAFSKAITIVRYAYNTMFIILRQAALVWILFASSKALHSDIDSNPQRRHSMHSAPRHSLGTPLSREAREQHSRETSRAEHSWVPVPVPAIVAHTWEWPWSIARAHTHPTPGAPQCSMLALGKGLPPRSKKGLSVTRLLHFLFPLLVTDPTSLFSHLFF